MKKILILTAIVALAASAACTKVETFTPDRAISFQVAKYVPQTKANSAFEGTSFTTNAWFLPAAGTAQQFMNDETVELQGTSGSAYWAPERTYFWPKTGTIDFFSYAGTPAATSVSFNTSTNVGTVAYGVHDPASYVTIDITDDPLLAEGAYGYSDSNYNNNSYNFMYNSTDVTGVPTLFHHMAAKVSFIVKFDASDAGNKNKWELTINKADFIYADEGEITVSFSRPGTLPNLSWPYTATGVNSGVNWTAETGDNRTLAAPATGYTAAQISADATLGAVTIGGVAAQTITNGDVSAVGGNVSDGKMIFKNISVVPQTLATTTPKIALCYSLKHYYDTQDYTANPTGDPVWTAQTTETVNLTDAAVTVGGLSYPSDGAILIDAFCTDITDPTTAVGTWEISHKYVYTINIKPNHEVRFSPAVVDWDSDINAGYVYPND